MAENGQIITVTGFGPFRDHKINASWEAVKLLPEEFMNHKIIKEEIPVSYSAVEERVPPLWHSTKPKLVIHVGVSHEVEKITIEKMAYRYGYQHPDCHGNLHPTGEACMPEVGDDCISTNINIMKICNYLNNKNEAIKFQCSENVGRYLCGYIYYSSLRKDPSKCLFIHVPPIGKPYSVQELKEGILQVIDCILNQECSPQT